MKRQQYVVIVPVKSPAIGKSRLRVPDHARPGLATGFALDTLHAARATPGVVQVVVMTDDAGFARTATDSGFRVVPDGDGLNHGLVAAATAARSWCPDAIPVALCADLPCLTSRDLSRALAQVDGEGPWIVADADGTGTTMYAATYDGFAPRFGSGSRLAHVEAGACEVAGDLATLRRDVDDEAALVAALRLGPGPHTKEALALLP